MTDHFFTKDGFGETQILVPMQGQYEQQCNAAALAQMGVPVLKKLDEKRVPRLEDWLQNGEAVQVQYRDNAREVIERVLDEQVG